jgi:hypothetical protein
MSDERPLGNGADQELAELWRSQKLEGKELSMEEIRGKADKFERYIRVRNGIEYAAALVVLAGFGPQLYLGENLYVRAGALLILLATARVVYVLHKQGSAQSLPAELGRAASLDFYRSALERQRDLLLNIWKWYLLPFVPGIVVSFFGFAVRDGVILNQPSPIEDRGTGGPGLLIIGAGFAAVYFFAASVNKRKARKIQAELDALEDASLTEY